MSEQLPLPITNRVICSTRAEARAFLATRMTMRELHAGDVLYEECQPFDHAIFPHRGVISLLARMEDGRTVEKASIGNEGFLGFTYLRGGRGAIGLTVVQIDGYASFLRMSDLDEAMETFTCVRYAMLLYSKALISQLMELVACNGLHSATQRVARWLLHADDRMNGSDFPLTQEALSQVLGLRRATVSASCSQLSKNGAIRYSRGMISVSDRTRLRSFSCECYDRITARSYPITPDFSPATRNDDD
ncbi:Crp/Fnr family transcriptional regulator [Breoghania corrubedonensis]|nr:Crp/Fnr family transcriptional regulator [Breoghania corrubedonensis]